MSIRLFNNCTYNNNFKPPLAAQQQTLIAPRRNEKDILSNKRHHRTENLARFGGELSRTSRLLEAVTVAVLPKIWGELPHQAQEFLD
jgi:hypothetical protein